MFKRSIANYLKNPVLSRTEIFFIISIYTSLLGVIILKHEPWFDEGQVWLLVRDLNPLELLIKYLRYESSPGLWHLLLMIPAKLNFPYSSLNFISGIIAITGVYVFLRYAPFPRIIKFIFPFSVYICYQYAVVARSYVLMPLLLFLIAKIYRNRFRLNYQFFLLLSLLALVSLHGTLIAVGLLTAYLIDLKKLWPELVSGHRRKNLITLGLFGVLLILIIFIIWPPSDILLGGKPSIEFFSYDILNLVEKNVIILSDAFITNFSYTHQNINPFFSLTALLLVSSLLYISMKWFRKTNTLALYIFPTIALIPLFSLNYAAPWHQGIIFLVWVFGLWVSLDNKLTSRVSSKVNYLLSIFLVVLLIQMVWSFKMYQFDYKYNYSGSRSLAKYIQEHQLDKKRIFAKRFGCIEVLPYFKNNIFINYHHRHKPAFWLWSSNSWLQDSYSDLQKFQPDYLIINFSQPINLKRLRSFQDYQLVAIFPGGVYWKNQVQLNSTFALYQKRPTARFPLPTTEVLEMIATWQDG